MEKKMSKTQMEGVIIYIVILLSAFGEYDV